MQLLEDTEVYRVRAPDRQTAALKIARAIGSPTIARAYAHEARILEVLNGEPAPSLLAQGTWQGHDYLVTKWCSGVQAMQSASDLRGASGSAGRRARLIDLCVQVAASFDQLHQTGIIHGDVSYRNIFDDDLGKVSVIDFGASRIESDSDQAKVARQGVPEFFEPEWAAAARDGREIPLPTLKGEQYALGALIY